MKTKKQYYFIYTVLFALILSTILGWYHIQGKIPVRFTDGVEQLYIEFVYVGRWFRKIFKSIIIHHQFSIPMWDSALGYGQDTINTISGVVGDPFYWLSAIIPSKYSEAGFVIILVLRLFFSGITFSWYLFYKKRSYYATLMAALIYTFSASLFIGFVQQIMIPPFYIFPLVMLGIDKLWNGEKATLYILALAFSFINYYYFAYMMAIFIGAYCILYYFLSFKNKSVHAFFSKVGKFLLYSIISVGISSIALLPVIIILSQNERLSLHYAMGLFYDRSFTGSVITGFITQNWMGGRDCIIGFAPIVLPLTALMLTSGKKNIRIKIEFLGLSVGLLIPLVGHVLNGFSYAANRWVWAYCLVVCVICADVLDNIEEYSFMQFIAAGMITVIYGLVCIFEWGELISIYFFASLLLSVIAYFILFIYCYGRRENHQRTIKTASSVMLPCMVVGCCIWTGYLYHCPNLTSHVMESADSADLLGNVENSGSQWLLRKSDFADGTRYDEAGVSRVRNSTWLTGISGMDFYMNICNPSITSFNNHMGLLTSPFIGGYSGLNRRSQLEAMMGVNQYIVPKDSETLLPYGYSKVLRAKEGDSVYSKRLYQNIFYSYEESASWLEYMNLSPFERQQLIMRSCVIDGKSTTKYKDISLPEDRISYVLTTDENVQISNNTIEVKNSGATASLTFKPQDNAELYIEFRTFAIAEANGTEIFSVSLNGKKDGNPIGYISATFDGLTPNSHMYGGKEDWLINLGYLKTPVDEIEITFMTPGVYSLDDLAVYALPKEEIEKTLQNMKDHQASHVSMKENQYSAEITLQEDGLVFCSVPYSRGWQATVDGEPVEILRANDGFMAVRVKSGRHVIEYHYVTPGLVKGTGISVFFVLLLLILCIWDRKKKRNLMTL